jgi:hypothetical protein
MEYFEQESAMNPLLKRKTLSSLLGKKLKTSNRSIREDKNPVIKSRLYKKAFKIISVYIKGRLRIINIY